MEGVSGKGRAKELGGTSGAGEPRGVDRASREDRNKVVRRLQGGIRSSN